jgi:hypothetical protein
MKYDRRGTSLKGRVEKVHLRQDQHQQDDEQCPVQSNDRPFSLAQLHHNQYFNRSVGPYQSPFRAITAG